MTLAGAEQLMGILGFMVVFFPVTWLIALVLALRVQKKHHIKFMHLYGPPELCRQILDQENEIACKDREIELLEAEKKELYALLRGVEVTTAHTQQALAGVIAVRCKGGEQ